MLWTNKKSVRYFAFWVRNDLGDGYPRVNSRVMAGVKASEQNNTESKKDETTLNDKDSNNDTIKSKGNVRWH